MSIFNETTASCQNCGQEMPISWAASVNADRRPDLRAEVIDGTFQSLNCPTCGTRIRLPPHLTYIDMGRGTWVLVESVDRIGQWKTHEAEAIALFDETFGRDAPESARSVGEGVHPRLVFGWPPLREKIVAAGLGLDDITLELLKLAIIRNVAESPIGDTALRLVAGDAASLRFEVTNDATEAVTAETQVPRSLYDDIAADTAAWAPLRERLTGRPLVDVLRFTLEG